VRVRWRWARRSFQSTANSASSLEDDDVDWADIMICIRPPHTHHTPHTVAAVWEEIQGTWQ
jgi:hypothetical protein